MSLDRLAALEAEIEAIKANVATKAPAPPVRNPTPDPLITGQDLVLHELHEAARLRRQKNAEAEADRAALRAQLEAPLRAERDAEIQAVDDEIARSESEYLETRDRLDRERHRLLHSPLAPASRKPLAALAGLGEQRQKKAKAVQGPREAA